MDNLREVSIDPGMDAYKRLTTAYSELESMREELVEAEDKHADMNQDLEILENDLTEKEEDFYQRDLHQQVLDDEDSAVSKHDTEDFAATAPGTIISMLPSPQVQHHVDSADYHRSVRVFHDVARSNLKQVEQDVVLATGLDDNSDALFLLNSIGQQCDEALDHMIHSEARMQLSKARLIPQMWTTSFDTQARSEPCRPRSRATKFRRKTKSDGGLYRNKKDFFPTVSVDEWILECLRKNSHHKLSFMSILQRELGCLTQPQLDYDRWEERIVQSWTFDSRVPGIQQSTPLSLISPMMKSPADGKELRDSSEQDSQYSPHHISDTTFTVDLDCDPASAVVIQRQLQAAALCTGILSYMESAISSPVETTSLAEESGHRTIPDPVSFPDLVVTAPDRGTTLSPEVAQSTDQLRVAEDCLARFDSAHNSDIGYTQRAVSGTEERTARTMVEATPTAAVNWGQPDSNPGWLTEIGEGTQCSQWSRTVGLRGCPGDGTTSSHGLPLNQT
jgi:hypothetical protein